MDHNPLETPTRKSEKLQVVSLFSIFWEMIIPMEEQIVNKAAQKHNLAPALTEVVAPYHKDKFI